VPLEAKQMMEQLGPSGHVASWVAIATAFLGVLPPLIAVFAALMGVLYYAIQIVESRTFQHWISNRRMKGQSKKLASLKAQELVTTAKIAAIETARVVRVDARELVADAAVAAKKLIATEAATAAKAAL
jgi:uncharacterized membrane protein YbaN (DUF454 family)